MNLLLTIQKSCAILKMFRNKIRRAEVAKKLGISRAYTTQILNGLRRPSHMEEKMRAAVEEILAERDKGASSDE